MVKISVVIVRMGHLQQKYCFPRCEIAIVARKILKPMKEGLPFDGSISKNFKHLGVLILIGGGIWSVTKLIIDTTTFNGYHIRELFRPEIVTNVELSVSLDTAFFYLGSNM